MTTVFDFTPSVTAPYQFQPTLDGQLYTAVVKWNLAGQRWYLELDDQAGNVVFLQSLKASQVGQPISTAAWDVASGMVTATMPTPHGYAVGSVAILTVSGMLPTGYNGTFECYVNEPSSFVYSLPSDPGVVSGYGSVSFDVNMAAGYFTASTLVWRQANNRFEVSP